MSELKVHVKDSLGSFRQTFEASGEDSIGNIKQLLLSCSILDLPVTSFSLKHEGTVRANDSLLSTMASQGPVIEFELETQRVTLADVNSQIERLRDVLGLGFTGTCFVNAGTTRIDDIKQGSKKGKLNEEELGRLVTVPESRLLQTANINSENLEGKGLSDTGVTGTAAVSNPNPLIPSPAAVELKLSHWQPLCRSSQVKFAGIIAFILFVSNDIAERHFIATENGFAHVSSLTSVNLAIPERLNKSLKFWPSLLQAIEHVSPSSISSARKRHEKIRSDLIGCSPVPQVTSTAPWLVGKVPKISTLRVGDFEQTPILRDWNEDFQSTRELEANTFSERIVRERSLCHTATEFATAATEGAVQIVEGAVTALNPLEDDESARLYLHRGIFYTYGSDFAQAYAGLESGDAANKAVKKGIDSVEQLMVLNIPELCPVLTAVVDYCGRRIVAQAPVPGIFRDVPLVVYGQSEEPGLVHYNEEVATHMKKFAEHLHLKKHPVTPQGLVLETSAEVHGAKSPDGRYYAIDLHRMQVPDLLFDSKDDLDFLRFEAVVHYFSENPNAGKLNPDIWMQPSRYPESYAHMDLLKDIDNAKAVSRHVREVILPNFVKSIAEEGGIDPIDGVQLTELMHRSGINMKHLGYLYRVAKKAALGSLASVAFEEALARSLKYELRKTLLSSSLLISETVTAFVAKFRGPSKDVDETCVRSLEDRLSRHFGFAELPPSWRSLYLPRISLLRLLSVKMGLQWNEKLEFVAMHPLVRFTFPKSSTATEAIEAARLSLIAAVGSSTEEENTVEAPSGETPLSNGNKKGEVDNDTDSLVENQSTNGTQNGVVQGGGASLEEAFTVLEEAVGIYGQIYGNTHSEMAQVLNHVATLFFEYAKNTGKAISYVRKAIKISERVKGIDSFQTLVMYTNLAYIECSASNWVATLQVARRIISVVEDLAWPGYAGAASLFETVAVMLLQSQRADLQKNSLSWFSRAIELRKQHPSGISGVLSFQHAQSQIIQHNYVGAARSMDAAYSYFKAKHGADDPSTKEVKTYLDQLLKATVVSAKKERADAFASLNGNKQLRNAPLRNREVETVSKKNSKKRGPQKAKASPKD